MAFRQAKRSTRKWRTRTSEAVRLGGAQPKRSLKPGSKRDLEGLRKRALTLGMNWINKLIFVQDFDKACAELSLLSHRYPTEAEVHFRWIEVATRTDSLADVVADFQRRSDQHPSSVALQLAALLGEIRLSERSGAGEPSAVSTPPSSSLVNPSLQRGMSELADVVGLSASAESLGGTRFQLSELRQRWDRAPRSPDADDSSPLSFRLNRQPLLPDDLPLPTPHHLGESFADIQASIPNDTDETEETGAMLARARALVQRHPQNYAAWFVSGCAHEFEGQLNQAIEAWLKAAQLNPSSICTLATLSELQQMGALPEDSDDFAARFEEIDPYLVHGQFETHQDLYKEFLAKREFTHAIAALRTLADWVQRQRNEVPLEIELLCLLGAMQAYNLEGKHGASDACRREAENLAVSCRKSPRNTSQLAFVAQMCEEYGLKACAKMCFFAILTSPESPVDVVIQTAAHCVAHYASPALRECLAVAYGNTRGHSEVRFCQLLCALSRSGISVSRYMERKTRIRSMLMENDVGRALPLLTEALADTEADAEIHYYLGEIFAKLGSTERARTHFRLMFDLDYLNPDSLLRYVNFLAGCGGNDAVLEITKRSAELMAMSAEQQAELHSLRGSAMAALGLDQEARSEIASALRSDPWNPAYLQIALRTFEPEADAMGPLPQADFRSAWEKRTTANDQDLLLQGLERGHAALKRGHVEYAYLLSKILLAAHPGEDEARNLFSRAGAGFHSRLATQQCLLLLQRKGSINLPMAAIATMAASIYACSGEWELVDEWIDIAQKSGVEEKLLQVRLFELEALKLTIAGKDYARATNLIEAAIDASADTFPLSPETTVLQGYLMVVKGDLRGGIEKMRTHISESSSIQSYYFYVKALERAGRLHGGEGENLARLFQMAPTNSLEQRFLDEIHLTVGVGKPDSIVNLTN